jgi:hypothetical protein
MKLNASQQRIKQGIAMSDCVDYQSNAVNLCKHIPLNANSDNSKTAKVISKKNFSKKIAILLFEQKKRHFINRL